MNRSSRIVSLCVGATLAISGVALAEGEHDHQAHEKGMTTGHSETEGHGHDKATLHGGQVTMTKDHHFETVFSDDGIRVFFYTDTQAPMMVKKASGKAILKFKDGKSVDISLVRGEPAEDDPAVHFCPMHEDVVQSKTGVCTHCGGMKLFVQDFLYAKADLSGIDPESMKASFAIDGLAGDEPSVAFTETYQMAMETNESGAVGDGHGHGMEGHSGQMHE